MRPSIGIVGQGFVGGSVYSVLSQYESIGTYDLEPSKSNTESLAHLVDQSDIIFVSVPTPMKETGECYTGIVEDVLSYINEYAAGDKIVITKSTSFLQILFGLLGEILFCLLIKTFLCYYS